MNKNDIKPTQRAPRNRTIYLDEEDRQFFVSKLRQVHDHIQPSEIENCTICQDIHEVIPYLPASCVDLMFIDPPYNLTKAFNGHVFKRRSSSDYACWIDSWLSKLIKVLKPYASVYFCGDWLSSASIYEVLNRYFIVRNRITWEREKGRGQLHGWKNCSEDIWFCTVSDKYTFNVESVKVKRRVIAPYTSSTGDPKDWERTESGNYRLTYPSNIWTDITVPYWSMPENTDHPTQKPEKLLAKIILASSNDGDLVFDPFLGSGTTSVVAKKLGRKYLGIDTDQTYCCLAEKRLKMADCDASIQGYENGVFWERNAFPYQNRISKKALSQERLF